MYPALSDTKRFAVLPFASTRATIFAQKSLTLPSLSERAVGFDMVLWSLWRLQTGVSQETNAYKPKVLVER